MASDFDEYARRAARREQAAAGGKRGLTRRHVVKGAAWSAPVIMTAMAAPAFAVSPPPDTLGGECGNQGTGVCKDGSKCNGNDGHCNNCRDQYVCGGEGARCCPSGSFTQCDPDPTLGPLVCLQGDPLHEASGGNPGGQTWFCRRPCTSGCAPGQVCHPTSGYCVKECAGSGDCGGSCLNGYCSYAIQNNINCT